MPGCRLIKATSFATLAVGLLSVAGQATAQTAEIDPEAHAKVMLFVAGFADEANVPLKGEPDVAIDLVDLNEDGSPEALVVIMDPSYCGSLGCSAFALDLSGPVARSIGDFAAIDVQAMSTTTNGWRDVLLNGRGRFIFEDGRYVFASTSP